MLPRPARPIPPRRRTWVAFAAGGRRWAIPAEEVGGVAELGPVTRLPTADPALLGVTLHRGRPVALLAVEPGSGAAAPRAGYLVALRAPGEALALPADELLGLAIVHGEGVPDGYARWQDHRGAAPPPALEPVPALAPEAG